MEKTWEWFSSINGVTSVILAICGVWLGGGMNVGAFESANMALFMGWWGVQISSLVSCKDLAYAGFAWAMEILYFSTTSACISWWSTK